MVVTDAIVSVVRCSTRGVRMSVSILMVGSEALPFSKTGGLADVLGALPAGARQARPSRHPRHTEVSRRAGAGHDAHHSRDRRRRRDCRDARRSSSRWRENVKAVLVDRPELYDRDIALRRRRRLSRQPAALRVSVQGRARVRPPVGRESFDILHAHDWQAGLAPVYLRTRYAGEPRLSGMTSIFTIHNLAYQGNFPPDWLAPLELGPEMMSMDALEFWGQISLLKGGIVFSDSITTVSPTYAREIQTKEYGVRLRGRAGDARGRSARHPERHRHRSMGSAARSVSARALRRAAASRRKTRRSARCSSLLVPGHAVRAACRARSSASSRAWSIRRGSI